MIQDTGISDGSIEIDGVQFYAEDLKSDQSQSTRDMVTTTVMNGTSVTTQGEYLPMIWTFTTTLFYPVNEPDYWNDLILELESKPVTVLCPLICLNTFKARCVIKKGLINQSCNALTLDFTLTEIPDTTDYYIDNNLYTSERLSIYEARVLQEKEIN